MYLHLCYLRVGTLFITDVTSVFWFFFFGFVFILTKMEVGKRENQLKTTMPFLK